MRTEDIDDVVSLQREAFPPPFSEDLLWSAEHLDRHIGLFPEGQFVAEDEGGLVGSCSNTRIDEAHWNLHTTWDETVGGPFLASYDAKGSTIYGLDISVAVRARRQGVGRAFYDCRFTLVRDRGLARYGTGCRLPDLRAAWEQDPSLTPEQFVRHVVAGARIDRTLTPLLRYGLTVVDVAWDYMEDPESMNAAALLEWKP